MNKADKEQEYVECGCCGGYHRCNYFGDCRNDTERFSFEDLIRADVPDDQIIDIEYD